MEINEISESDEVSESDETPINWGELAAAFAGPSFLGWKDADTLDDGSKVLLLELSEFTVTTSFKKPATEWTACLFDPSTLNKGETSKITLSRRASFAVLSELERTKGKLPIRVILKRIGEGFQTSYICNILE